ncbi:ARM repeat-containing protein [Heliocybe sulcata]|uniref:Exportin-T n=1 Tax=Heliocybe sulcata TaxID=5364 RepID=A0A5C3MS08_9AGAM|nr:ARM repeat-containing protein [Heliocybe sulcata]
MDQELNQVVQAILIASEPTQSTLHQQALEYLSNIQENAAESWRLALALFVDTTPDGARKHPPQVRFFGLQVLDVFLDNRFEPLDEESFTTLQQGLVGYIQSEYVYGQAEASAPFIRNKFSHTMTLFFLCTYVEQWPSFLTDLFTLIQPSESSSQSSFNPHVSLLFFHIILEISGEVADAVIKSARHWNAERHARDTRVRDAVRDRDAARINEAVLTIVANGADRMNKLRKGELNVPSPDKELSTVEEVVDWGIRTFASYVGWIDINLTVTPTTIPLLFSLLSDPALPIRLATCAALTRILSKGLKEPSDKLQLIKVLSLGEVLDALETRTRSEQEARSGDTDEGEESYREALGKLLNILGLELMKLIDECQLEEIRSEATRLLDQCLPVMLRFMSDEYDDTSATIFPMLSTILSSYKKAKKVSSNPIDESKRTFLTSLLRVILEKFKWDEYTDDDEPDEDDKAAFETLRKDLRTFLDAVLVIDQDLVTDAVRTLSINTLTAYRNGASIEWTDAELAVYLIYIYGEINKAGGKGRAAFCQAPSIPRGEDRRKFDYSEYPLTSHGEMLYTMSHSGISAYPNSAVAMQFFETAARYGDFFKVRKDCVLPVLEAMVDTRGLHNPDSSVRSRVFYLFHRFVKEDKHEISSEVALRLIDSIRDLLLIRVELPQLEDETQDMLTEAVNNPGIFDSQLYLFETSGILVSLISKAPEQQAALLMSVVKPLLDQLATSLQAVKGPQDYVPILEIHHIIMALGNIAKGFPDYPSEIHEDYNPPPLDVFKEVAQAILTSLNAMNVFKVVRDATRFAFARIIATTGPNVTSFIPPLMANLLAHFELSELVDFMNFIGLLVHKLQLEIFDVLDQLIGPLSERIMEVLSQPVTGTDDQVAQTDTKRAYLNLLNTIVASSVHGVFISERNRRRFQDLLENMERIATDVSDPSGAKAAFNFLGRCIGVWGGQPAQVNGNGSADARVESLPGIDGFIYQQLVPLAFKVLALPNLNIKDGQILVVLHEIANFLQIVCKARGQEAYDFFTTVFLPAQGWPQDMTVDFATKLRDFDSKNFRKYFVDLVRTSRAGS